MKSDLSLCKISSLLTLSELTDFIEIFSECRAIRHQTCWSSLSLAVIIKSEWLLSSLSNSIHICLPWMWGGFPVLTRFWIIKTQSALNFLIDVVFTFPAGPDPPRSSRRRDPHPWVLGIRSDTRRRWGDCRGRRWKSSGCCHHRGWADRGPPGWSRSGPGEWVAGGCCGGSSSREMLTECWTGTHWATTITD